MLLLLHLFSSHVLCHTPLKITEKRNQLHQTNNNTVKLSKTFIHSVFFLSLFIISVFLICQRLLLFERFGSHRHTHIWEHAQAAYRNAENHVCHCMNHTRIQLLKIDVSHHKCIPFYHSVFKFKPVVLAHFNTHWNMHCFLWMIFDLFLILRDKWLLF